MAGNYYDGIIEGLTRYAWWKDGVQYVGTCGSTLRQAIADVEAERQPDTKEEKIPSPNKAKVQICPECGGDADKKVDHNNHCSYCDFWW